MSEVLVSWVKSTHCDTSACVEVNFQTSSHCAGGDCVEVSTPGFRKSQKSADTANCVEVADCGCGCDVLVRDSKDPDGPVLSFSSAAWADFIADIRIGALDL